MSDDAFQLVKSFVGDSYSDDLIRYALSKRDNNAEYAIDALFSGHITSKDLPSTSDPSSQPFGSGTSKMKERFVATFVCSAAGDAIGFKNGKFEFNKNGLDIHRQVFELGGIENIECSPSRGWKVSDDTVLHKATGKALIEWSSSNLNHLYELICKYYIIGGKDMEGRAPGDATMTSLMLLEGIVPYEGRTTTPKKWNEIPFMPKGGGNGAAMRAMCIGLKFYGEKNRENLIAVAIESARMTHNHPCGFLGAVNSALFTAFAIEGKPIPTWGVELLKELPKAEAYVKKCGRDYESYKTEGNYPYFEKQWTNYLHLRNLLESQVPKFPSNYGISERDGFYKSLSFDGWGGSSGHDINIVAYDALLGCNGSWEELVKRGVLHSGDNDSTGAVAGAWFGAVYGFTGVFQKNIARLEYKTELVTLGETLFVMSDFA